MSNSFLTSMTNFSLTQNEGATNKSSLSHCVDLFFQIGSMRSSTEDDVILAWTRAFLEDPEIAIKILFWARDVRQGAGERKIFRTVMRHIALNNPDLLSEHLISLIPEFGRWDDLFVFFGTPLEKYAANVIENALQRNDALCAKWMPREKGSKSHIARALRQHMGLTPKAYRKTLSGLTSVVENKMCQNEWANINYSHVPSQSMRIYKQAFERHAPAEWNDFITKLSSGEAKVNAAAIHPHEILGPYIRTSTMCTNYWVSDTETEEIEQIPQIVEEQWNALPNWMSSNTGGILPVVDTSGSMTGLPIRVAVSLGIYIAERTQGPFRNHFVTFSENPTMQMMKGETLRSRLTSICNSEWGMNTNLEKTFEVILHHAKISGASAEDLPGTVLILSDMEFDRCINYNETAMQSIRRQYSEAGFTLPRVVFWNLNARPGNVPVTFNEVGVALISGFSPSIMQVLLDSPENFTPESIMRILVDRERYNNVTFAV